MRRFFVFLFMCFIGMGVWAEPTEIVLWHSMAGQLGHELQSLVNGFNHRYKDFEVKLVYKGDYIESLTSFAAAFRAHVPPALVQVFEVGTTTMLSPRGIIKPLHELMAEGGATLPQSSFFPTLLASYAVEGQLMAMPLNTSVPAIFFNKEALAKVGYNAENFPKTWDSFEILAEKVIKSGFSCAYTTAYPAWILIESFSAIHGLPMMDTEQKAVYNNQVMIHHLSRLKKWQKMHYFVYGGRSDDATILFTSGRCPLLSQSSGGYRGLSAMVPFEIGMAAMPLEASVCNHRAPNVVGGAALWAVAGSSPEVYQGIARFFVYLAEPKVQQRWHEHTGYLPLGVEGVYKSLDLLNQQPSLTLAHAEWAGSQTMLQTSRMPAQNQIREINDEALESLFAGMKNPKEAMDDAVRSANHALLRFKENTT